MMSNTKSPVSFSWKLPATVAALFVAFIVLMNSFYVNSEYERSVITRMGEFHEITGPGLQWKVPFIDSRHAADTRISSFEYPNMQTATKDGQAIGVSITINHRILNSDESLMNLFQQFGNKFAYEDRLLRTMAIDRVKGVVGQYAMEDFMPNREMIRQQAANAVREAAVIYGINIEDVQLSDVQFSPEFKRRLEQVAAARARAAEAAQREREATFAANQKIEEARGQAESQKALADASAHAIRVKSVEEAEAIRREGLARAEAMKAQNDVLRNAQGLIEYTKAQSLLNWDGKSTPQIIMQGEGGGMSSLVPFMNVGGMLK